MKKDGFTLLEVTLFLAISSSLALIAFVGLGPRLRNVRFTDAVRGVETSIKSTVESSQRGASTTAFSCKNVNGTATVTTELSAPQGTSQDCVNGGVVVYFQPDSVKYYRIALLRERAPPSALCPSNKSIEGAFDVGLCFGFKWPADVNQIDAEPFAEYKLTNGLKRLGENTFIGYVVNPEDGRAFTFIDGQHISTDKKICYELSGRKASLNFSTSTIQPRVEFNDAC